MPKLCVPIKAKTVREALKLIKKAQKYTGTVEIWLDQIKNPDIKQLFQNKTCQIIAVNKNAAEQGSWSATEQERIALLIQAAQSGADYIDIGIETDPTLIKKLIQNKKNAQIIISYHNFISTPPLPKLLKIKRKMAIFYPDIFKFATTAKNQHDNVIIYNLILAAKKHHQEIVAHCMGEKGIKSRIIAPILGSHFYYAALDQSHKTASGQLTVDQMHKILEMIV